jgi:hypothetical protein
MQNFCLCGTEEPIWRTLFRMTRHDMLPLTKEQEAALGLELATKRQEHADLDAAIHTLTQSGVADQMLIQRLKKRKLSLKDRIVQLENLILPDIIA